MRGISHSLLLIIFILVLSQNGPTLRISLLESISC